MHCRNGRYRYAIGMHCLRFYLWLYRKASNTNPYRISLFEIAFLIRNPRISTLMLLQSKSCGAGWSGAASPLGSTPSWNITSSTSISSATSRCPVLVSGSLSYLWPGLWTRFHFLRITPSRCPVLVSGTVAYPTYDQGCGPAFIFCGSLLLAALCW